MQFMRQYVIVTTQLWAVIAKPVSFGFVRICVCVCCLQVTHRTADDHNVFLLLERSWLSFYLSLVGLSFSPYFSLIYVSIFLFISSRFPSVLSLLCYKPLSPDYIMPCPSHTILSGWRWNKYRETKNVHVLRTFHTMSFWFCYIAPAKAAHQQQTIHPAQV